MINKQLFYFTAMLLIFSSTIAMEKIGKKQLQFPVAPKKIEKEFLEELRSHGIIHDVNIPDLPIPLEQASESTEYWRNFKKLSPEKKKQVFQTIRSHVTSNGFYIWRYLMAAAIGAGVDPDCNCDNKDPKYPALVASCPALVAAVVLDDTEFAQFLLNRGANPCAQTDYFGLEGRRDCIFEAQTETMATLLLNAGANVHFNLLHHYMITRECDPALVLMCRKRGVSPFALDYWYDDQRDYYFTYGDTALHTLAQRIIRNGENVLQSSEHLLYGLSPSQIIRLCTAKNLKNQTALDILDEALENRVAYACGVSATCTKLTQLLKEKMDDAIAQEAGAILLGKRERGQVRVPATSRFAGL